MRLTVAATLEEVLANWHDRSNTLRVVGDTHTSALIDKIVADVERAERARLTWLNDVEAALYSGLTIEALHRRFPRMADHGDARWSLRGRRERQYRESALPRRKDREIRRASAEDAARRAS